MCRYDASAGSQVDNMLKDTLVSLCVCMCLYACKDEHVKMNGWMDIDRKTDGLAGWLAGWMAGWMDRNVGR